MRRGGATHFIGAILTTATTPGTVFADLPQADLAETIAMEVGAADAELLDCLLVDDLLWWSYLCTDDQCCPEEGKSLPTGPSPAQVEATVVGMTALRS